MRCRAGHAIGQAACDAMLPVLEQQLLRAGVRLAAALDNIFAAGR